MRIINDALSTLSCILFLIEGYRPYHYTERLLVGAFGACYFALDIAFFTRKKDFIFHHGLAIWIMYASIFYPYSYDAFIKIANLEFSTLFLNLHHYVTGYYRTITQILFFLTFFKIRIVDFVPLLYDHELNYMQWLPLVSLYMLNLYWFRLICKKIISKN